MIKLGIIGLSEGNGHPYSWSAIINGYNPEHMRNCGFPVIAEYLAQQKWPDAQIPNAKVTHIWTQSQELSHKIAKACYIENVVTSVADMLGHVDAVLLARDDAELHYEFAKVFLTESIPVYIDKPIALSIQALEELYKLQQYPGQIFTCSALRYSKELQLEPEARADIGELIELMAITPKSWDKYAVHVIEPVLNMLDWQAGVCHAVNEIGPVNSKGLTINWNEGVTTRIYALGDRVAAPISIRVFGSKGWKDFTFVDSFTAFKSALMDFIEGVNLKVEKSNPDFNRQVVKLIELGRS